MHFCEINMIYWTYVVKIIFIFCLHRSNALSLNRDLPNDVTDSSGAIDDSYRSWLESSDLVENRRLKKKSVHKKVLNVPKSFLVKEDPYWPSTKIPLGIVTNVACSPTGELFVISTPFRSNILERPIRSRGDSGGANLGLIHSDPIHILNIQTGSLLSSFGRNRFIKPHGLSVDSVGNVYITDTVLQQVFRFPSLSYSEPDLTIGTPFIKAIGKIGASDTVGFHQSFCEPQDIAIHSSGDFYVSNRCNSRISFVQSKGSIIRTFGENDLLTPTAMTLLEEELLCVADEGTNRIVCFLTTSNYMDEKFGSKNFEANNMTGIVAMDHIGEVIFAVKAKKAPDTLGITYNIIDAKILDEWSPRNGFIKPTAITVSRDQQSIFVCDSSVEASQSIYKFTTAEKELKSQQDRSSFPQRKSKSALKTLNSFNYTLTPSWPILEPKLGQVTAIDYDNNGNIVIFHRGSHKWDSMTFNFFNRYTQIDDGPINVDTVVTIDPRNKSVVHSWGKDLFYMPHGLTLDTKNNIWLTDVALHQILKYPIRGAITPLLIIGQRFNPGNGRNQFCKPTSVAIDSRNDDIYVADGYCNSRVVRFSSNGSFLNQWGQPDLLLAMVTHKPSPYSLYIPHKVILALDYELSCVADREHGRIQCFNIPNGQFRFSIELPEFQGTLYSISYAPQCGGILYAVNGGESPSRRGFLFNITTQKLLGSFSPEESFSNPHDIVSSKDCKDVFVVEIGPNNIWRFQLAGQDQPTTAKPNSASSYSNGFQALSSKVDLSFHHQVPVVASRIATLSGTTIVLSLLIIPLALVVVIAIVSNRRCYRLTYRRASLKTFTEWVSSYKANKSEANLNLSRILKDPRSSGFNQLATDDSDNDNDGDREDHSESEVEEFNINSVRRI